MGNLPSKEALEGSHHFPCRYTIKVFGPNHDGFTEAVKTTADTQRGAANIAISYRPSAKGKHVCVTLDVFVESAEQVLELYVALQRVDSVSMML